MFTRHSDEGYRPLAEGITMKNLVLGDRTMMIRVRLVAGAVLQLHSHPHEQTGVWMSGRGRFTIGGETYNVGPGDSWNIPGGVEHAVEALEESEVIELFAPVREAYLP